MESYLFSPDTKMADIFHSNLSLATLMPRLGIAFGFGDKSIAQCCQEHKLNCDFFLLVCNVYTFPAYLPDRKQILSTDMSNLLPFLSASHEYYLNGRLAHIENHWKNIIGNADRAFQQVLLRFFAEYKDEVQKHFEYEEQVVFPYINLLQNAQTANPNSSFKIEQFEKNHSNIEDKLKDFINIILKYLPGTLKTEDRLSVLYDIDRLSSDLNRHSLIEDKILVPYVKYLEEK